MQAHPVFYSPNRPPRVVVSTDVHPRSCQNCCQTSKLLSSFSASKGANLPEFRTSSLTPTTLWPDPIATLIWADADTMRCCWLRHGPPTIREKNSASLGG